MKKIKTMYEAQDEMIKEDERKLKNGEIRYVNNFGDEDKNNEEIKISIKDIPEVVEQIEKAIKEIDRLNNIITELEKYINKIIKEDEKFNDVASRYGVLNCKYILDKLKELKEGK